MNDSYAALALIRRGFREQAKRLFAEFDIVLAPATPRAARFIGQRDVMISFIGLPVGVVPAVGIGPLPLGVRLIGPAGGEARLPRRAHHLEAMGGCSTEPAGTAAT